MKKITFFWNFTQIFLYQTVLKQRPPLHGLIAGCKEPSQEVWSHCIEK